MLVRMWVGMHPSWPVLSVRRLLRLPKAHAFWRHSFPLLSLKRLTSIPAILPWPEDLAANQHGTSITYTVERIVYIPGCKSKLQKSRPLYWRAWRSGAKSYRGLVSLERSEYHVRIGSRGQDLSLCGGGHWIAVLARARDQGTGLEWAGHRSAAQPFRAWRRG